MPTTQTIGRLHAPLPWPGSLDRRFARASSHSALSPLGAPRSGCYPGLEPLSPAPRVPLSGWLLSYWLLVGSNCRHLGARRLLRPSVALCLCGNNLFFCSLDHRPLVIRTRKRRIFYHRGTETQRGSGRSSPSRPAFLSADLPDQHTTQYEPSGLLSRRQGIGISHGQTPAAVRPLVGPPDPSSGSSVMPWPWYCRAVRAAVFPGVARAGAIRGHLRHPRIKALLQPSLAADGADGADKEVVERPQIGIRSCVFDAARFARLPWD